MPKAFFNTGACRSHRHCHVCRNRDGGRRLRQQWATRYTVPAGGPDFDCPDGFPWGFTGTVAPRAKPPYLAARREICGDCSEWSIPHNACRLNRRGPCQWHRPDAACPAKPPKWGPAYSARHNTTGRSRTGQNNAEQTADLNPQGAKGLGS